MIPWLENWSEKNEVFQVFKETLKTSKVQILGYFICCAIYDTTQIYFHSLIVIFDFRHHVIHSTKMM